mgnify:CR=1 FL=1
MKVLLFSSPSRGSYISTNERCWIKNKLKVLVPFSGFLYLYKYSLYVTKQGKISVLVPFSGFLYLYDEIQIMIDNLKSSRPLLGVLISLRQQKSFRTINKGLFSSPSRGSYISTIIQNALDQEKSSRPLLGVLISLHEKVCLIGGNIKFSSPSRGSYISTIS